MPENATSMDHFLQWRYPSYFMLQRHLEELRVILKENQPKNIYFKPSVWEKLSQHIEAAACIDELRASWDSVQPFIGFNAQSLMQMKFGIFDTLDACFSRFFDEIERDRENISALFSMYERLAVYRDKLLADAKEKEQRFRRLQYQLKHTLYLKGIVYSLSGRPKNIEDLNLYFIFKINALGIEDIAFIPPTECMDGLSDDVRLSIYEFLKQEDKGRFNQLDLIKNPISYMSQPLLVDLGALRIQQLENEENVKIVRHALFQKNHREAAFYNRWLEPYIVRGLLSRRLKNFLPWLSMVWRLRWYLMLAVSLMMHTVLIAGFITPLNPFLGAFFVGLLERAIFFGVTLIPAYVAIYQIIKGVLLTIYNAVSHSTKCKILHGVDVLENQQNFITCYLSFSIRDIVHYDLEILQDRTKKRIIVIEEMLADLQRPTLLGFFINRGALGAAQLALIQAFSHQKALVMVRLKLCAEQVEKKLKEKVREIRLDITNNRLDVAISSDQIKKIQTFVDNHCDQCPVVQSNDLIDDVVVAFRQNQMLSQSETPKSIAEPWGGYELRKPTIRGFIFIIEHFETNLHQKNAITKLLSLLLGEYSCTLKDYHDLITAFSPKQGIAVNKIIQECIYLTLPSQPQHNFKFLSDAHKSCICDWYHCHSESIKMALQYVENLIKPDHDTCESVSPVRHINCSKESNALAEEQFFLYLEANDICCAITGKGQASANKIKKLFDSQDGHSAQAVCFVKFIPDGQKITYVSNLVKQRIDWLIKSYAERLDNTEGDSQKTDLNDIELFKHPSIKSHILLKQYIISHDAFAKPYLKELLTHFVEQGFIGKELLIHYNMICDNHACAMYEGLQASKIPASYARGFVDDAPPLNRVPPNKQIRCR